MHFHLPKPLHGWREFAGEVGIIVLGVLIALGVEQLVQAAHDRQVARDARQAVNLEIGHVLGGLQKRAATEPCIARRLAQLDDFVGAASSGQAAKPLLWVGRPQTWTMGNSAWNSASQAGRTALFSPRDQNEYANVYASFATIDQTEFREQDVWAQLRALEGQTTISPTAIFPIRSLISEARTLDWRIRLGYVESEMEAAPLGITPIRDDRYKGSISVCVPSDTPRERALQIIDSRLAAEP